MSSKYARRFAVPDEFPEVMKGFTREVLRDIPKDLTGAAAEEWIYKFGVSYFSGQQNSQREAAKADLGQEIRAIFKAVDKDGNGVLDVKEFRSLLSAFTKELGLSKESALLVMAEADSDGDGKISYEEFVPLAIDVIEAIRAKKASAKEESERKAEALQSASNFLLHGLPPKELEAQLLEAFEEADEDRSGNLSRDEFYTALKHSGLGLTRKEMNVLMTMVDEDADGSISYAEFVPVGINTLIEVISQEIAYSQVSMEEADIRGHLQTVFMTMDTKGTGKLSRDEIADCLAKADLGLRPVQQYAILSEAVADEDGLVNYVDFASIAATLVSNLRKTVVDKNFAQQFKQADVATINGMNRGEFTSRLREALQNVDVEGNGLGSRQDVATVLSEDLGLSAKQVEAVLHMASTQDGAIDLYMAGKVGYDAARSVSENAILLKA